MVTRRTMLATLLAIATIAALAGCAVTPSTPSEFSLVQYPAAGFRGLYAQTASATTSIDMELYELQDPLEIAALVAARHRGVVVRVLLNSAFEGRTKNGSAYAALKAGGVEVRYATSSAIFHIKTTTFDGTTSDISTANLTPQYYSATRDATVIDTYPVHVAAIESTFEHDWNGDDPGSDESNAPGLVWSPDAESAMVNQIGSATSTIYFTSEELSDPYIYQALAKDAQRGVKCRVVMTEQTQWDKAFGQLTAAGCVVHVYPDTTTGFYVHEKLILVDAGTAHSSVMVGSQNASYSSLSFNRELSVILTGAQAPSVVDAVTKTFNADFVGARRWPTN